MSFRSTVRLLGAALCLFLWSMARSASAADAPTIEANRVIELSFTSDRDRDDPFNAVELDVEFQTPTARRVRVPAFWAGGKSWKVRYASGETGLHRYTTRCTDPADRGLHERSGTLTVTPYRGDNPLYRHGPIRVAPDRRHLAHADGTPFFWLGDTWWMGLSDRLHWPDEFRTLAKDRLSKGFNVVQIVAGLYPDMPAFDPRGRNEAGFPWEEKYARIRPEYFDRADERIQYLADQGIVPCVVMAWGYHIPWLGVEKMKDHVRYVMARWGALPVVWCMAGEVNLPYYLEKGFPLGGEKQTQAWEEVIKEARSLDELGRLITVHPTGIEPLSGRLLYRDQGLLDFDMLQTGHGGREVLKPTIRALRASYKATPPMPVLNSEVSYEALLGRIPAEIPRMMFWTNILSGAAGHTYGANGIWQLNRRDQPYGKSPHGGTYGPIPWDEAMNLPGSGQLGIGKKLLEQLPWQRFEPHPEWASWGASTKAKPIWGDWIWYPEGDPRKDAPVEPRFFRKAVDLPAGKQVASATLRLTADDKFVAYLNGKELGAHANWSTGKAFEDIAGLLHAGRNVIAVKAENGAGPKDANPAGLCGSLVVTYSDGSTATFPTDVTWICSRTGPEGWQDTLFGESDWEQARALAKFGEPPWGGAIGAEDEYLVPYAAGIVFFRRVVYVPLPRTIRLHGIERDAFLVFKAYDPTTGQELKADKVRSLGGGDWEVDPPSGIAADWVLVVHLSPKVH